ncbi:MAG: SatD family protein [Anaerolineaceae bacterium]|nr:SatD family protein [Anaerolineaceae bacterium]
MNNFFFNNTYVAIIADIKGSKAIENREIIQEKLKMTLHNVNNKYSTYIGSKFTITLGDEFQGLLFNGEQILPIISEIEQEMYPISIRYGVGIGEITTHIDPEIAIGADGPGYYKAREALEYLKQTEKKKQAGRANIRIEAVGKRQPSMELINSIFSLLTAIKDSWTERQRETIWNMLNYQDSQNEVAERLGITQPSVQKNLVKGSYYEYKDALGVVQKFLSEIGRKDV